MRLPMMRVTRRILVLSLVLGVVLIAAPRAQAIPPVVRPGWISASIYQRTPCAGGTCVEPVRALVTATALDGQATTSTAKTDAQGKVVMTLTPGRYLVSAASLGMFSRQSEPMLVWVYPMTTTAVRIVLPPI